MKYRKLNNLFGWITASVAFTVYLLTMERTVSFWDCGEFLSCAYKMEIGHAPGAPFFMLLQRLFAIFSGPAAWTGQPTTTAVLFINGLSALSSALTILFLFWTITHMARKLLATRNDIPDAQRYVLIIATGTVGALAYTFSDTFWFSAVEAEVYATSSFFTALVFWAMLKWEDAADKPYADRWLVLISLLVGISIGVHLLNLLTIPALAMVYYFRKYKATKWGILLAFMVGCGILGFIQFGVIQILPIMASGFDLFFVNTLGLPFDTGAITFILLLTAALVWALRVAKKKAKYLVHTSLICLLFILLGFSAYLVPVIRSRADVPVDMTNPDNVMSLVSYVQREQYLQQPLLYGQDFNSRVTGLDVKGYNYSQVKKDGKDHYEITDKRLEYEYDPADLRFFPRIWDVTDPRHAQYYRSYLNLQEGEKATGSDNLSFFFGYQINWLWWRYFMWNYAGRQNDFQGEGDVRNGNWISGIKPLDNGRIGNIDAMSSGYAGNKARNELYFLPLALGILGMVYQFNRHKKDGLITIMLFFFTGAAIAIYLNMYPYQPRDRDYAFAGGTYAFAIWIGLGILMVYDWWCKLLNSRFSIAITVILCFLAVPVLMAKEEWDDHDRSGKSLAWASAYNTLISCEPNAILFTSGDNDTYPLWYLQEVEGIRKDVRVVIMELASTDWLIDQLQNSVNDAPPVPMVWKKQHYLGGRRTYLGFYQNPKIPQDRYYDLHEIIQFIISDDPQNKVPVSNGEMENYLPARNFEVPSLSIADLVSTGLLSKEDSSKVVNEMKFTFPKNNVYKNDLVLLNIIAANAKDGWKRPIYFNGSFPGNNNPVGLGAYLKQEGVVYRLVPYRLKSPDQVSPQEMGSVNLDKSLDLYLHKYKWGGADGTNVYFDEKNRVMLIAYRLYAARIADELTKAGRKAEAISLLDKVGKSITEASFPYEVTTCYLALSYYKAGDNKKAADLSKRLAANAVSDLKWVQSLDEERQESLQTDIKNSLGTLNMLSSAAANAGDVKFAKELQQQFETWYVKYNPLLSRAM